MPGPEDQAVRAQWAASWTQAVTDVTAAGVEVTASTVRFTITPGLSGSAVRVQLSNRYGPRELSIGRSAIRVGERAFPLMFDGSESSIVPAGGQLISDPLEISVSAGAAVEIDLYLPETETITTGNFSASTWMQSAPGDHTAAQRFPGRAAPELMLPGGTALAAPTPILRGIDVLPATQRVPVVVCLGDSITAAGWPERAAERLHELPVGIVNRGIPGNRLRFRGAGPFGQFFGLAGAERFDEDVLDTAGRTHVAIALGTNDLGHPGQSAPDLELPTADELIRCLDEMASRARRAGVGVFLATITPFLPATGYDAGREAIRVAVNDWIRRTAGPRVFDFDAALRNEGKPSQLAVDYDSGDHLHPNLSGLDRLADESARVIRGSIRS